LNTEYLLANIAFVIFPIALTGAAFFLFILVLAHIFKWPSAKEYGLVGLIVFSLVGIVPLIDLTQRLF
jgi:predicted permease